MSESIFLSASVPKPGREFHDSCHPYQIHAAVRSLLVLALGRRHIVFGGHPSITPMVYAACQDFDLENIVCATIYQSKYFEDKFPLENQKFSDMRLIPAKNTAPASIAAMRERMLSEQKFTAGVFIGGMNGILDEYKLFTDRFPDAKIVAVRAGGGATATLPITHQDTEIQRLELSREYFSLYASVLGIDPSSERNFAS
jgi:hypothetical protein